MSWAYFGGIRRYTESCNGLALKVPEDIENHVMIFFWRCQKIGRTISWVCFGGARRYKESCHGLALEVSGRIMLWVCFGDVRIYRESCHDLVLEVPEDTENHFMDLLWRCQKTGRIMS